MSTPESTRRWSSADQGISGTRAVRLYDGLLCALMEEITSSIESPQRFMISNRQAAIWHDTLVTIIALTMWFAFSYMTSFFAPSIIHWVRTRNIAFNFLLISTINGIGLWIIAFGFAVNLKRFSPWRCFAMLAVIVILLLAAITPWRSLPQIASFAEESLVSFTVRAILGPVFVLLWIGLGIAAAQRFKSNGRRELQRDQ